MRAPAGQAYRSTTVALLGLLILASLVGPVRLAPRAGLASQAGRATLGDAPVYTGGQATRDEARTAGTGPTVNPAKRAASAAFYLTYVGSNVSPAIGWTGSFASCIAGTTTADFKEAVRSRIVYYRAMAGVPSDITLPATFNEQDQQAALMMGAAGALSREPGGGWPCFTAAGAAAAASSNLALDVNGPAAIDGYIWDFGENNADAGHRRWLLYPQTATFGTGDVPDDDDGAAANALWVFDGNLGGPRPATRDGFVAWPPPGYVPYQVVYPRWSFSYPGADFSGATVTMTSRGAAVPVAVEPLWQPPSTGALLGEPPIVWRPNNQHSANGPSAVAKDTRFQVTIANVIVAGQTRTFAYDVIVFDPASPPPPAPLCLLSRTTARVGSTVGTTCQFFEPNETVDLFWKSTTSTPRGSFVVSAAGSGSTTFRVPSAPAGTHRVILKGRTSTSIEIANLTVQAAISISPRSGETGDPVKVTLTGYRAGETIAVKWWNLAGTSARTLATVVASTAGTASTTVVLPRSPAGSHKISGNGSAGNTAATSFSLSPPAAAAAPTLTATATADAAPTIEETPAASVTRTATEPATATPTDLPEPTSTPETPAIPTDTPTTAADQDEPASEGEASPAGE